MLRIFQAISLLLTLLVSVSSCSQEEKLYQGELYFKMISFGPEVFSLEHNEGQSLSEWIDTLEVKHYQSKEDKKLKDYYNFVQKHRLMTKPYFHLLINNNRKDVHRVYASESEFSKIDTFKLRVLQDESQKVLIDFLGVLLDNQTILCTKIKKIRKVPGDTKWHK